MCHAVTYSDPQKQRQFFEQLIPKLQALPGIEAAGGAMPLPFSGNDRGSSFWISGRPDPGRGEHPIASHLVIMGDYFRAMRISLLAGRNFDNRDAKDSPLVVMVNEEFVRKFFPNENPIGQHIVIDRDVEKPPACEIVGVVASTRHESLAIAPIPEFYVPAAQESGRRFFMVLRTEKTAGADAAVRRSIHDIDPDIYVPAVQPLQDLIGSTLAQPRFHMALLGCFAGVALILAAIGIYGVIAYTVVQRTKEIGIRMALGAQRSDMLRMVLRQSFSIVSIGLFVGLVGALALTRLMTSLLYGVSAHDLPIYAMVLLVLSAAALIASYMPARRARTSIRWSHCVTSESAMNDLRFAFRQLLKQPLFTAVALVALALGIGANTAIFSVVNAVLLKPLPFPQPEELVSLGAIDLREGKAAKAYPISFPNFADLRAQDRSFSHIAVYRPANVALSGEGDAQSLHGQRVSAEFFDVFGIRPVLGRTFQKTDELPNGGSNGLTVILSHAFWQRQFKGDSNILGRKLILDGQPFTVVGVMPPSFEYPINSDPTDLYVTSAVDAVATDGGKPMTEQRGSYSWFGIDASRQESVWRRHRPR